MPGLRDILYVPWYTGSIIPLTTRVAPEGVTLPVAELTDDILNSVNDFLVLVPMENGGCPGLWTLVATI